MEQENSLKATERHFSRFLAPFTKTNSGGCKFGKMWKIAQNMEMCELSITLPHSCSDQVSYAWGRGADKELVKFFRKLLPTHVIYHVLLIERYPWTDF